MNFDKLTAGIISLVIIAASTGQLPKLQLWIWKAQAKLIHESRTSTWGSPRFFPKQNFSTNRMKARGLSHSETPRFH